MNEQLAGFAGWSQAEVAAAAAATAVAAAASGEARRGDDSDDDGFFEQSSLGDSDTSRADDAPSATALAVRTHYTRHAPTPRSLPLFQIEVDLYIKFHQNPSKHFDAKE